MALPDHIETEGIIDLKYCFYIVGMIWKRKNKKQTKKPCILGIKVEVLNAKEVILEIGSDLVRLITSLAVLF